MYILKIGLVLLTGAGFGFGVEKISETELFQNDRDSYNGYMEIGVCHGEDYFLDHMLEDLSDEDLLIVQEKIDDLLLDYSITLDELNNDYEVMFDFMNDLMEFLEENGIDYHNHNERHNYDYEDDFHYGMGMH